MQLKWAWTCASAGVVTGALAAVVACGARTELDVGPSPSSTSTRGDSGLSFDVRADRRVVAPVDAGEDVHVVRLLDCADAGTLYVYTIGEDGNLYSFYPATSEFTLVGAIDCPVHATIGNSPTPFSMAVDHLGIAYVVYKDGNLYRVSTKTAACEATSFVPDQHGFTDFGMGFVASVNDAGEGIETLYVASESTPSELATIDIHDFKLSVVAPFGTAGGALSVYMAELTSTRDGRLFGFFAPDNSIPPSYIIEIDPRTAAIKSAVELPSVVEGSGWAFGFWGGDFYTFTAPYGDTTVVTRYRPKDGTVTEVATAPANVMIVGAGVSTCAPQQ